MDMRMPVSAVYQRHHTDMREFGGNRLAALERDGYACMKCGMTNAEHVERWDCTITVDHIDGQGRGQTDPNSVLENLQTLCLSCHGAKDAARIDYERRDTARGERSGRAKLTAQAVREIRAARSAGALLREIAAEHGLSVGHVHNICNRLTWKHI